MKFLSVIAGAAALAILASGASAGERYGKRPPLTVSPDLSAPWVMQLKRKPGAARRAAEARAMERVRQVMDQPRPAYVRRGIFYDRDAAQPYAGSDYRERQLRTAAVVRPERKPVQPQMNPIYLPQTVDYDGPEKAGTIVIDTTQNFLYHVQAGGKARRYGVGTGKPGFEWAGTHKVTQKRVWPDWRPPAEMIARERAKGRILPVHMKGGPANPLGARALYLGSTLYRIHGTNQPWTIGQAVSSGCIRMRNEDVIELYERVSVGTRVVVR
ncbi:L,D-transpeptidase [Nitratireductor mangrovi]|uniref:L,D-transpeptidase n=1 Tax=Nitratireductor mangrovi TaxID=2599600 RepID=A0A5B8L429_9HYPH|nr:L,D-transpeptidase [Nitratireductor mangrovi]QDZ02318.1 L,D-transpeptidase [Nitratireductor mangrovi]